MTDTRLQELKRAWEASGTVEDEAAYLSERVRVGELARERVELAAYVGHGPALLATGLDPVRLPLGKWVGELQPRGGVAVLRRAALAAAGCALERWGEGPLEQETRQAWDQAKRFVRCPCELHRLRLPLIGAGPHAARYRLWLSLVGVAWPPNSVKAVFEARIRLHPQRVSERVLRERIRDEIVAWVLGDRDPLLAGWDGPLARYPRGRLIEEARRLQGTEELEALVLDPGFADALQTTSVEDAVDRALGFRPHAEDSAELHDVLERYTEFERTRDGVVHEYTSYFATGWRELWPEPTPRREPADYDFRF